MKKLLLFNLILWQCNIVLAQTNVYHPFPSANAIWSSSYMDCVNLVHYDYCYYIPGDTLINGITYHKINKQVQQYKFDLTVNCYHMGYPPGCCPTNIVSGYLNLYMGAIRENTVQKKVYLIQKDSASEQLLYDFNIGISDTVKGYFLSYASNYPPYTSSHSPLIITSIDSTLIGGTYRKIWNLDQQQMIIEGIGLLPDFLKVIWWEAGANLNCFSENNQELYPYFNSAKGCELILSIKDEEKPGSISIFPNPTNGKFQLTLNNKNESHFEITDVLGNIILGSEIKNETTEIDLSAHPFGIYFVRINDLKGNFVVKKIVKE